MRETRIATITVTSDKSVLWRIWSDEYADRHAGKTYEASIADDGWAHIEGWKFPPHAYEILTAP